MSAKAKHLIRRDDSYMRETTKPLYGLIFILPLLLLFHFGAGQTRVGILVLSCFRRNLSIIPPLALICVLLIQHLVREDGWKLRCRVFGGMIVESVVWVLPLMAASHVTAMLFLTATQPAVSRFDSIMIGVGGGIYEEFVFHLIGIGLIMLIFATAFSLPKIPVAIVAVILTAVLFAFSHTNIPPFRGNDPFTAADFAFRIVAAVCLGTLFILRGFGIAVGAHVMWNIYIFVM